MSTTENEFEDVMERVRAGDADAGKELFERYTLVGTDSGSPEAHLGEAPCNRTFEV
jgi:hypothetical protein